MIGKTVSHYRITRKLGQGGMGTVYKAEDIRLGRTVALKFLASDMTRDQEAKIRFVHEAQATSALEHPNICTVYEIDENRDGSLFICMAFYAGETLRDVVKRGACKVELIYDLGIQICEGLIRAHEVGVVHRDIKPANLLLTDRGELKIVDFGLAKLSGSTRVTKTGTTMGTIAYKSPEQTRGEDVDPRTDIWSTGVVLYELASGRQPFKGEYEQAVIYSILHEDPDPVTLFRDDVPLDLERVISKCLEKDPDFRYQSTVELAADLKRGKRDLTVSPAIYPSEKKRVKRRSPLVYWMVLIFLLLAVLSFYTLRTALRAPAQHDVSGLRLSVLTRNGEIASYPTWSPDGDWIAYASDEGGTMDIWKRPTAGGRAMQLTYDTGNESQPAWSPDGRNIAYRKEGEGGGICLVPAEGGDKSPTTLTAFGSDPGWLPDGERIAFHWGGEVYSVPYGGGAADTLLTGISAAPHLTWLPDGRRFVFWHRTSGDIHLGSVGHRHSVSLNLIPSGEEVGGITMSRDGRRLIYSRGPFGGQKDLWMAAFDPVRGNTRGNPFPLSITATEDIHCRIAPDGRSLAFTVRQLQRHLLALELDPASGRPQGAGELITSDAQLNYYPSFSPDGRKLIYTSHSAGLGMLFSMDMNRRLPVKVTTDWGRENRELGAGFGPDNERIVYSSTMTGSYCLWRMERAGSSTLPLTRTQHPNRDTHPACSPDGSIVAFYSNRQGNWDIWTVSMEQNDADPVPLLSWPSNEMYPAWSPDSRSLFFRTDRSGNADIWTVDIDGENPRSYITSPHEEGWCAWSPNGRWFYFTSDRDGAFNIWVRSSKGGKAVRVTDYKGPANGLSEEAIYTRFAVSDSMLVLPVEERAADIYLLENIPE